VTDKPQIQPRTARERTFFHREITAVCRWSHRYAFLWIGLTLLLTVPAFMRARTLGLDSDLTRLLPQHSPAVQWSRDLEPLVGDGGYFSLIFEQGDPESLSRVVDRTAARLQALEGITDVNYRYPTDFVQRYRYGLMPSDQLETAIETIEDWEAEVNPFLDDLDDSASEEQSDLERIVSLYSELPEYHRDADNTMYGMILRTSEGLTDLAGLRELYLRIDSVASEEASAAGVTVSIGGSLRTRVEEFDVIISDVTRTGAVAVAAILLTLAISFRSVRVLPVLLYPIAAGLIWAFAFVPDLVGDLNTITSFLLMVLFGMGVDYSIHLVKRFRHELLSKSPELALAETFTSTGRSVATSGLTTSFGLFILTVSDFRGFSDFGWIGGTAILVVTACMLLVMPATLSAGYRLGLVTPTAPRFPSARLAIPPGWSAALLSSLVILSAYAAAFLLEFDYDFANFSANLVELDEIREKQNEVYPIFFGPSAIYVARDLEALDEMLALIGEAAAKPGSVIGRVASVRDFAPNEAETQLRRDAIDQIQEMLRRRWVGRIENPERVRVIEDVRDFEMPDSLPTVEDLPESVLQDMITRDNSGAYILGLHALGPGKDGVITMRFTRELYDLPRPDGILGPTGDKPVLAEILWLVTREGPLIVVLTFLGVFILVVIDRRDVNQAAWVLVPLVASLLLTFGAVIVLGWRINFFNMVVLPTLLGLGVDHGVHYYRRWRELGGDTAATQLELFEPITVATLTTIMGYAGMAFAHHPGLRSIGLLAVVGLLCTWVTAVVLLPGLLVWHRDLGNGANHTNGEAAVDA
jgi:predicted RND superfamily exporter protein